MSNPNRIANLLPLLDETPISYYWIGFLMADGHFYKHGALKLQLSEKDRHHLEKFRLFVNYTGKSKTCLMSAMNPIVVHKIMNKFKITNRKTYEPCSIDWIKDELLFSLIVGLFDGDGHFPIRNNHVYGAVMKLHKSWLTNLKFIETFLYEYLEIKKSKPSKLARMNKNGYAVLVLSDRYLLAKMKKKSTELNLPMMKRKWDGIDVNYVSLYREYKNRLPKMLQLIERGLSYKQIGKICNVSVGSIATAVCRERKKQRLTLL